MNTKYLTSKEIAEILGISKAYVYKLLSSGIIPIVRIGKKSIRVKQEDFDKYIQIISECEENYTNERKQI